MKTFAEKKVIYESRGKEDFALVVQMKDFRACAKAYKNGNWRSGTFVALAEAWGVNFHTPEWYHEQDPLFKTGISTFDEAKKMSTDWLREICEMDD